MLLQTFLFEIPDEPPHDPVPFFRIYYSPAGSAIIEQPVVLSEVTALDICGKTALRRLIEDKLGGVDGGK